MNTYHPDKLSLVYYPQLVQRLPKLNPIVSAFERSRKKEKFLQHPFFVYEGDIEQPILSMGLDTFHPNTLRTIAGEYEPYIYPIILGNLTVNTAYFDGYVSGNIKANHLYAEYRMQNIELGCGGNLTVNRLLFIKHRTLQVAGNARIHTFVNSQNSQVLAPSLQVDYLFNFPMHNRNDDFSHHSLQELQQHFNNYACDELPRIDYFYGKSLDAMLPLASTCHTQDIDYINPDR